MELEEEQHQPPTVKPSLVRSSKKNYKEKRFNLSGWGTTQMECRSKPGQWLTQLTPKKPSSPSVQPQLIPLFWVEPLASPRVDNAIRSHSKTKIHQAASVDPNQNIVEQMTVDQGFRNQEEIYKKDGKEQENILLGQISFTTMPCEVASSPALPSSPPPSSPTQPRNGRLVFVLLRGIISPLILMKQALMGRIKWI